MTDTALPLGHFRQGLDIRGLDTVVIIKFTAKIAPLSPARKMTMYVRGQERAGPAELPDSRRYWKIEKQEVDLTGQLGELEQGTRRRNRDFEAKLRAIEERMLG